MRSFQQLQINPAFIQVTAYTTKIILLYANPVNILPGV